MSANNNEYAKMFGNINDSISANAKCACIPCNACTCACRPVQNNENEEFKW